MQHSSTANAASNAAGLSESADDDLPSVMTCANYLKLPPYSTKVRPTFIKDIFLKSIFVKMTSFIFFLSHLFENMKERKILSFSFPFENPNDN